MRKLFAAFALAAFVLASCNNGDTNNGHEGHNMDKMSTDSMSQADTPASKEVKVTTVAITNLDARAAASIKDIVDHYLHIKNALSGDDPKEAAKGGEALAVALSKVDKSLLTAEQKKIFDENQEDLNDQAEHISKNAGDINHQRDHFASMSEDVYALVKAFGGGRPLYHDHCPMAKENKGAMWISELKEVKNPYFGAKMPTCGTVEELIK